MKRMQRKLLLNRVGYVQDERYIAIEHMDVRRDCFGYRVGNKLPTLRLGHDGASFGQTDIASMEICWVMA